MSWAWELPWGPNSQPTRRQQNEPQVHSKGNDTCEYDYCDLLSFMTSSCPIEEWDIYMIKQSVNENHFKVQHSITLWATTTNATKCNPWTISNKKTKTPITITSCETTTHNQTLENPQSKQYTDTHEACTQMDKRFLCWCDLRDSYRLVFLKRKKEKNQRKYI